MITAADAEFHPTLRSMTAWAETIGFWFAVPEAELYGNVYVQARPNVGATIAAVNVVQGINRLPYTVDFTDPHVHAPCPDSMLHFSLVNGLRVDVDDAPTGYRFRYRSLNGVCSFDLRLRGIMPAWDPHDPQDNPLLATSADLGLGDAWSGGHLDFIGHVAGELHLRGASYAVDSMAGMDRSWGRRTELGEAAISYLHLPFDDDVGIHLVMAADLVDDRLQYGPLRFGYVVDHGEVVGLVDASMTAEHTDLLPSANRISVTDARGRTWATEGTAVAAAPWYTFSPSYGTFQALMRYELDGRIGYGVMSEVLGIEYLAARTSRHGGRSGGHHALHR